MGALSPNAPRGYGPGMQSQAQVISTCCWCHLQGFRQLQKSDIKIIVTQSKTDTMMYKVYTETENCDVRHERLPLMKENRGYFQTNLMIVAFSYSMPIKIVVWEHRPPNARMTNSVFINRHRLGLKRKQNDRTWSSVLIFEAYEVFRWPQAPLVAFACGICRIIYLCVSVRLEAYRNIWPYIYGKQGNVILRQLKFRLQGCLQQGGFTSRQRWK